MAALATLLLSDQLAWALMVVQTACISLAEGYIASTGSPSSPLAQHCSAKSSGGEQTLSSTQSRRRGEDRDIGMFQKKRFGHPGHTHGRHDHARSTSSRQSSIAGAAAQSGGAGPSLRLRLRLRLRQTRYCWPKLHYVLVGGGAAGAAQRPARPVQVDIDMPGTRCQLTWWVRLPALAAALAAVALLASGAQAAGVVSIDAGTSVALAVAVRVASRQITTKSNATVHTDAPTASIHLVLSIDPSLGPESFAIADAPAGQTGAAVVGGDSRGVYYGLGRLLRNSTFGASFTPGSWRGRSAPALPNGFRAMYLATHLENFYQAAPLAKVQEYVEDLALWGANTMALVMPWEEFSSFDDPAMVRQINMTTTLFKAAKQTGLGVGLVAAANQGFSSRPERIKACYPLPGNHFGEFNAHMPQVSTVKEGGVAYLLANFRELFQQYKTNEVDLDFFISWPYDEGGSACTGADGYSEWPWGARGFPNITHQLSVLGKQLFPNMRTVVSTWGFDRPAAVGEFAGLDQYIRSHPGAFDFTMADSNTEFPSWPIEAHHGPGDLPLLNFPEISMWGRTPWGGFGANPLPERFQQLWRPIEKLVSGGMPYSEGIFEDLNQAICFQHYWNASTTANQTVAEYIGFEFSGRPEVITTVSEAITLLEANYPISAHPPCFLPSCGGDS